ncbi:hypothetical protein LTR84_006271 [Exophiala bonariae]|uniref:Uncharacterized protein n=1 Tax=Exophiala bonariae TaxID=1690606 RepID=A0AAV9N211_9EURO|nr:hypothetical protein LTR84_006271 [Exophiala bonariae]
MARLPSPPPYEADSSQLSDEISEPSLVIAEDGSASSSSPEPLTTDESLTEGESLSSVAYQVPGDDQDSTGDVTVPAAALKAMEETMKQALASVATLKERRSKADAELIQLKQRLTDVAADMEKVFDEKRYTTTAEFEHEVCKTFQELAAEYNTVVADMNDEDAQERVKVKKIMDLMGGIFSSLVAVFRG